jgi:ribosome-associated translation inhibitor RaiA
MKIPLQVVFHGMEPSEALESAARQKADKLERFCADIMSCRVDIDELQKHQQQGRPYGVRIHLTLPGDELTVDRVTNEDAHVALRDAFDSMRRQLEDAVRRQRGQRKQHATPLHGEVVRLDSETRSGFIRTSDDDEYRFDSDNVADGAFDRLEVGARVQFLPELGGLGRQAKRVSLGKHGF